MGFDVLSFILKVATAFSTICFAILGLGTKARDDAGNLTKSGKIALIGFVLSLLLNLGTQAVDFYTSRQTVKGQRDRYADELARAQKLLHAVQRGIYPMKSVSANATIALPSGNEVIEAYKHSLAAAFADMRTCSTLPHDVRCYIINPNERASGYGISPGSDLFPQSGAEIHKLITSIQLFVGLTARDNEGTYRYIGRFFIDWWRPESLPRLEMLYDIERSSLSIEIAKLPIEDDWLRSSGVQSLIDIIPGSIFVKPVIWDDRLCEPFEESACNRLTKNLESGVYIERLGLRFPFPKSLELTNSREIRCGQHNEGVALALPEDVNEIDNLGNLSGKALPIPPCGHR